MSANTDYLLLVSASHADKPNYMAAVNALVAAFVDEMNVVGGLTTMFDVDTATGDQLDTIGLWVGATRNLVTPLTSVYFTWEGTAALGWDSGNWQGLYDPSTGLTALTDDAFRAFIKAKIAADCWDGTIPGATAIWQLAIPGGQVVAIKDNQDMTMSVTTSTLTLTAVQTAMLNGGYLPLKPAGVKVLFV